MLGGHSLRTGGAQALAGLGVDPVRIQVMGRWRSSLVIRYAGSRGSCGITQDTIRGIASTMPSSSAALPAKPLVNLELAWLEDTDAHTRAQAELDSFYDSTLDSVPTYVTNSGTGVVHKLGKPDHTLCGMDFRRWKAGLHHEPPANVSHAFYCTRCCRHERNEVRECGSSSEESQ